MANRNQVGSDPFGGVGGTPSGLPLTVAGAIPAIGGVAIDGVLATPWNHIRLQPLNPFRNGL
jgi:hypothetical protein